MEHIEQRLSSTFHQKLSDKDLDSRLKSASSTVLQQKLAFMPAGKCESLSYGDNLKAKYIQLTHKAPARVYVNTEEHNYSKLLLHAETPCSTIPAHGQAAMLHHRESPDSMDRNNNSDADKSAPEMSDEEHPVAPSAFVHCAPVKRAASEAWREFLLGTAPKTAKAGKATPKKAWKNLKIMVKKTNEKGDDSSWIPGMVPKLIIRRDLISMDFSLNAIPHAAVKKAGSRPQVRCSKSPAKKSVSPAQVRRAMSPSKRAISKAMMHRSKSPVRIVRGKRKVKKAPTKTESTGFWQNKYDKFRLKKMAKVAVPVAKVAVRVAKVAVRVAKVVAPVEKVPVPVAEVPVPESKPNKDEEAVCKDIAMEPVSPSVKESEKFLLPDVFSNGDEGEGLPRPSRILFPADSVDYEWRFPNGGPGYMNKGNTCFLNAVMQILTYTPPLVNYALSNHHTLECKLPRDRCALCNYQLHVRRSLIHRSEPMYPSWFVNNIQYIGKHFRCGRQEDAHEFLRLTLEHMQRACLSGHHSIDRYSKDTTVVNQIFGGFLRSQVVCLRCKAKSNTYDPVLDICVDIKNVATLERAFQLFVTPEKLDLDNAYRCDKCKQKVAAMKRFSIHKPPNILTVQLKRFQYTGGGSFGGGGGNGKITGSIKFPPRLDIRPYMSMKNGPPEVYSLYGAIMHEGWSMNAGHYTCIVRSGPKWFFYSDSQKRPTCYTSINSQSAYVLFYIKDNLANKYTVGPTRTPTPSPQDKDNRDNGEPVPGCSTSRSLGSVIPGPLKTQTKSPQNVIKMIPSTGSKPTNDLGIPFVRKPVNSAPLPTHRDKVSFGLKTPDKRGSSQGKTHDKPGSSQGKTPDKPGSSHMKTPDKSGPSHMKTRSPQVGVLARPKLTSGSGAGSSTPGATKPRIVMQIKHGKVTTIETSPAGQRKIVSDDDKDGPTSGGHTKLSGKKARLVPYGNESSDSDWSGKGDSPKVDRARKTNGFVKEDKAGGVVLDPRLNATTSVPGNAHLYGTVAHKERVNHVNVGTVDKVRDMKMPPFVCKVEAASRGKARVSEALTCVTSPVAGRDVAGLAWHVHGIEAEPSPSIGSSSSTHSNNSTSEWAVSHNPAGHPPTDHQSPGWTVTPGHSDTNVHMAASRLDVSSRQGNTEKPDLKAGMKRPASVTLDIDVVTEKLCSDDHDNVPLLNSGENKMKVKKHKKRKKHKKEKKHVKDRDNDHNYGKLSEDRLDSSSRHRNKKKHKQHKSVNYDDVKPVAGQEAAEHTLNQSEARSDGYREHALDRSESSRDGYRDHALDRSEARSDGYRKHLLDRSESSRDGYRDHALDRSEARSDGYREHALDRSESSRDGYRDHALDLSETRSDGYREHALDRSEDEDHCPDTHNLRHKVHTSQNHQDLLNKAIIGKHRHKNCHKVQSSKKHEDIHEGSSAINTHLSRNNSKDCSPDRHKKHHNVQPSKKHEDMHEGSCAKNTHPSQDNSKDCSPDRHKKCQKVQPSKKHEDIQEDGISRKNIHMSRDNGEDRCPDLHKTHHKVQPSKKHEDIHEGSSAINTHPSQNNSKDRSPDRHKKHHKVQPSKKREDIHEEGISRKNANQSRDNSEDRSPARQHKNLHKVRQSKKHEDIQEGISGKHIDRSLDSSNTDGSPDGHNNRQHTSRTRQGLHKERNHNNNNNDGSYEHQNTNGQHSDRRKDHEEELRADRGRKRKHDHDSQRDVSSHKQSRKDTSDSSSCEFEWVERPAATQVGSCSSASTPVRSSRAAIDMVGQDWDYHMKGGHQRSLSGGSTPVKVPWDGLRASKVASQLEKSMQYKYGAPVSTWSGSHTELDVEPGRAQTHDHIDDYEEDLDRGRVKKLKAPPGWAAPPTGNQFQREQQRRNRDRSMWDSVFHGPDGPPPSR